MLRSFRRFIGRLFRQRRPPYVPTPDVFARLDLDEVRKRLKPAERGRQAGLQDSPPVTATRPDHHETEIRAFFTEEHARVLADANRLLAASARAVGARDTSTVVARIQSIAQIGADELATLRTSGQNRLLSLEQRVKALGQDLARFKRVNDLQREPHYPESRKWHWGVLCLIALLEAVFNGALFQEGSSAGLLGGIAQALLFALVNVVLGVSFGRFIFPCFVHRRVAVRAICVFGTPVYIAIALSVNLGVAHYRDALQLPGVDPAAHALHTFRTAPLVLKDILSWLLFGLGLLFSIIAAVDGWRMDDAYPGYGSLHRRAEVSSLDYASELDRLFEQAKEFRDDAIETMQKIARTASMDVQHQDASTRDAATIGSQYLAHETYLSEQMEVIIREYRDANRQARRSQPPSYFDSTTALAHRETFGPPVVGELTDVASVLTTAQRQVSTAYTDTIEAFQSVRALTGAA